MPRFSSTCNGERRLMLWVFLVLMRSRSAASIHGQQCFGIETFPLLCGWIFQDPTFGLKNWIAAVLWLHQGRSFPWPSVNLPTRFRVGRRLGAHMVERFTVCLAWMSFEAFSWSIRLRVCFLWCAFLKANSGVRCISALLPGRFTIPGLSSQKKWARSWVSNFYSYLPTTAALTLEVSRPIQSKYASILLYTSHPTQFSA